MQFGKINEIISAIVYDFTIANDAYYSFEKTHIIKDDVYSLYSRDHKILTLLCMFFLISSLLLYGYYTIIHWMKYVIALSTTTKIRSIPTNA